MDTFDVVVIGAGPAGSSAAIRLARNGARVALVDRAQFPRDKPCGGGVTVRGLQHLPVDITPVVEDRITTTAMTFTDGRGTERTSELPLVLMTQRRRLDEHLVRHAADAGADVREGVRVRDVDTDDSGATVRTDHGALRGSVVVGADGCNGISAKALNLGREVTYGVAYEANVGWDTLDESTWRGRLLLEFGLVPGGYAWIFPKGDHANIGVGGWQGVGPDIRKHLDMFCERSDVPPEALVDARGYRLPLRHPRRPIVRGRSLVIGDAAGLVDPMSGDGMYEAFLSSRIAAHTIGAFLAGEAADIDEYEPTVNGVMSHHRSVSWIGKRVFDQFPLLGLRMAGSDFLWSRVEKRIRGDRPARLDRRGTARAERVARALALIGVD